MFLSQADQQLVPVHLIMTSGGCLKGGVVAGLTGKLSDLMAKPQPFIEFRASDGTQQFVSKACIERVVPIEVPRADQLSRRLAHDQPFDAHTILGVGEMASAREISAAYHALARQYHPDHYAGLNAPREVIDYVSAMFGRITLAYNELKTSAPAGEPPRDDQGSCESAPGTA